MLKLIKLMHWKLKVLFGISMVGLLFIGFLLGMGWVNYHTYMILDSFTFGDIIINMNETKMVEAMMPYIQ